MIDINKKYTSNGITMRILCTDRNSSDGRSVVAMDETGRVSYYTEFGKYGLSKESEFDLTEVRESKFSIGNYIKNTHTNIVFRYTQSHAAYDKENPTHGEYYELWVPKEGEWCYFWDNRNVPPLVLQFNKLSPTIYGNNYRGFNSIQPAIRFDVETEECYTSTNWNHCAPFNGEFPEEFKGL